MKASIVYFVFLVYTTNSALSKKFRYDNYTLFKIHVETPVQVKLLRNLQDTDFRYDFWSEPVSRSPFVQVMTSPEDKSDLLQFLTEHNMIAEISMNNVQEYIDKQTVKRYTKNNIKSMTWDAYYPLDDIYAWIDDLAEQYPDVVTKVIGGETFESREIVGVKISHGEGKRNIFIEGGIHAREWISPATVCYIISALLTSDDTETKAAAEEFDWHIFPVTNPDGYVWSVEQARMWRKNRRPFANGIGVDLNRNWNSNWLSMNFWCREHIFKPCQITMKSMLPASAVYLQHFKYLEQAHGASTNPASDVYAGPGPFSESETRSMARYMREIGDKMELFLTLHSFGQMLLLPFGNTSEPLANYHDAMNIGRRAMGALSVRYGTEYVTGNIVEVLYAATGGTDEWVKEHLQVPLVYCYELRDRGMWGFLLPAEQIKPTGEETLDSVIDLIHQGKRFGYMQSAGEDVKASVLMVLGMVVSYFL